MCSFRIAVSVLIFLAGPSLALANSIENCTGKNEGFEKADCFLNSELTDEYFDYVRSYYAEVKEEGRYDPALGFRFMESVARFGKLEYAELATEIYYWGLQADKVEPFQKLLEREVNYLSALLSAGEKEEFYDLLERGDPRVFKEIKRFWKARDVVRSSHKNERLLEHWERILYSKENFIRNDTTVYETDERGIIYIRFGEPNRIRNGQFGSATAEVRSKLYDLQDRGFISLSGSALHNIQQEILTSVIPAEYELWHYDDVSQRDNEHIFFLFGEKEGSGSFGLRNSVEEFIPQEAFSNTLGNRSIGSDIRVGNFLQFMYYSDLASEHMFFGNRLETYDRAWRESLGGGRVNAGYLRNNISRQKAQTATENVYNSAPDDASTYVRRLQGYDTDVLEYRFLDEEGVPELLYIVTTSPQNLIDDYDFIVDDNGQNMGGREFDMHLRQGISHFDRDHAELDRNMYPFIKVYRSAERVNPETHTTHSIALSDDQDRYAVVFSELYYSLREHGDNLADMSLIGVNMDEIRHIPTLDFESGELILSDIVLGTPAREKISVRDKQMGILEKGDRIAEGNDLQVYFEVYNLDDSAPDHSFYEVEYRVKSPGRSWWPFSSSTETSLTWEAAAEDWYDYQFFDIEAIDRKPGTYKLHIEVTEKETGRQAARSIEFKVI